MIKCNFHTHTAFCDGKNTPEEMVLSAISKGFSAIGFSGHSYTDFDESYCMSREGAKKYIAEINRLKAVYKDKIQIYLGIEADYFSNEDLSPFEYVIGSVHYVYKNGEFIPIDENVQILIDAVNTHYNGDFLTLAEDYFSLVSRVNGDIVGHIDLISKFNEDGSLFDETSMRYIRAAENAIKALVSKGKIFEINTGAMSRGYRKTPYPSENILHLIKKHGGKIMINSDAHDADSMDFAFDEAIILAKKCGFSETFIFDGTLFKSIKI